ncbi:uncharacterized protein I303_107308 [Kwoniella dejecticola CBS 10117]|uniref:Uncharacterized protein n=1 Tax=Kwoniella dejecticola CBS 10117 TaxID=1296121 RepID=A0A1A5ZZA8_9TREE|nr:uncharacterized protein I303_06712 [Kwoniella dejecticola CBS 10117]OBR83153.1 hypothetical protein I303_06712 [Kwoniella dejecticola CBS 10117]
MPIPPRPIPVHHPRHHRHPKAGSSVPGNRPRKSGVSASSALSSSLDWRSEINLLNELGPRSAPTTSTGGVRGSNLVNMVQTKPAPSSGCKEVEGKREVGIGELIQDGKGKREKRATTATTLGFDFIPNPTVLALDDFDPDSTCCEPKAVSLLSPLSTSKGRGTPIANNTSLGGISTPNTPTLEAQTSSSLSSEPEDEDEDELEEDWEYIQIPSLNGKANANANARDNVDDNVDSEGEEDVIVLGELELELDHVADVCAPVSLVGKGKGKGASKGKAKAKGLASKISYADALGTIC